MHLEQKVNNNTTVLQLGMLDNNVYIVTSGNNCVVIDCPFDNGQLLSYIEQHNLVLQAIVLTHGHFDHCGGVATLLAKFDVPVYCNSSDWQLCSQASNNRWGVKCYDCTPTHELDSGSINIGGIDFTVMHTPGHTAGGVCLISGEVLFSGDTLFDMSIGRTDLGGDYDTLMDSLVKLKNLEGNYILCSGHGQISTLSKQRNGNPYMVKL